VTGELNERIEILRPQRTPDGGGGYSVVYVLDRAVYARTERRGSVRERLEGSVLRERLRVRLRRTEELLYEMRLRHRDDEYRITRITDEGRSGGLTIVDAEAVRGQT
jgi:head-tail adaptor